MALFDRELLKRLHYLSLVARQAGGSSLLAARRKKLPAGGTEVTGLRDYAPGDDYRYIDWIGCAGHDELLTKKFEGDTDLHAYVLLDCSASMGQGNPSKFRLARQIAAALGYVTLLNMDRLGVVGFSGRIVAELSPMCGKPRIPRVLRFLQQLPLADTPTDLTRTVQGFVRRYQRHGIAVVISDLYDREGFARAFDLLRHRGYEPRLVHVYEPREADPGLLGDAELVDVETGAGDRVTITERAARRYRQLFEQFRSSVRQYCAKHAMACMQIASDTPEDEVLLKVLSGREKRVAYSQQ